MLFFTYRFKKLLLFISVLLVSNSIQASHLIGGDLSYSYLGSNKYRIQLQIFRDCNDPRDFDNPASITVYESNGKLIVNRLVRLSSRNKTGANLPNPCLIPPPGVCVETGIYIDTVLLPNSIYGYDIAYESCCHNNSVLNIKYPNVTGMTMTSHIPSTNLATYNSSAQFILSAPVFICVSSPFTYDFSATDNDGDSLVYNLCTPFDGLTGNPANPPPYTNIVWAAGYSATNPIPTIFGVTLNQKTGELSFTPTMIGQFEICVCVEEYRNGNLINTTRRELQLNTVPCETISSIPSQTIFCNGLTVDFQNTSTNATFFFWNFGAPTLSDTSHLVSPSYTYADTGKYKVMLVAINNNGKCRDTAYTTFQIYPKLAPTIPASYTQCFNKNNFSFQLSGVYSPSATFNWNFGNHSAPNHSTLSHPNNIIFDTLGTHTFSVIVSENGCSDTLSSSVKLIQNPIASFYSADTVGCPAFFVSFVNTSTLQTPLKYNWSIENKNDTTTNPDHTFFNQGTYSVRLVAIGANGCSDTLVKNNYIHVNPKPQAIAIVDPVKTDIIHPDITFSDKTLLSHSTFFDLGDGYSDIIPIVKHTYVETGKYNWFLIVTNNFGCKDTTNGTIVITETNQVYIPNSFTPNNDGRNDEFKPVIAYYKTATLQLFDRWGNSIFITNDIEKGWNGNFKNSEVHCQIDTYIYKLNVTFMDDFAKEYKGIVTLVK